jgi:hypothetical protein
VLEVTGRLATALMRRACTDEMAEARAAARPARHHTSPEIAAGASSSWSSS